MLPSVGWCAVASFPRTILPFEVTSLDLPGPLISKSQSGRVNIRTTQQIGRSWEERFLVNVRSVDGRALLATVDDYWRNGTIFTINHRDHLTPVGAGGGSPLINQPTQLVTDPENFGAWGTAGTIVRTAGQADPFGGTGAYLLDSNASGTDRLTQNVSFTGDATKAISLFVRAGTSTSSAIALFNGAVFRGRAEILWAGGVPSLSASTGTPQLFSIIPFGSSWYWLAIGVNGVVAADTNQFLIYPDDIAGLGTVYVFGANAWNNATPAGYIGPSHPTATGTRLYVDGATASVTNWLRAGDIVSVAGLAPVYEVTANVNSEAGGYASIPVNPPIFTGGAPSDNAVVMITGVTLQACILEPPTFPTTSGSSYDFGELRCAFSEVL